MESEYILTKGEFIATRFYYNYRVNLYRVGLRLFEAFYDPETNDLDRIDEIEPFKAQRAYKCGKLLLSFN